MLVGRNVLETCLTASVLIVGGGPCGLMLANELGRRGVSAILVDEKPGTAFNPQANATQARSMEHYRRLGFADEIRREGLPADYPTDVAYFTRYTGYELARFQLPSSSRAGELVKGMSGSWNAAELPHRVSQKYVEAVLRRHAERLPGIRLSYGHRLISYVENDDGVVAEIECLDDNSRFQVRADFLVGADGPRSMVRQSLGIVYGGETGAQRDFMGGRMLAVYLRSPEFYASILHAKAWMYNCFNGDRRAFMASVNGRDEFAFHTQLRPDENENAITIDEAKAAFQRACGAPIDCEVLSFLTWTAGHALVANGMQRGRVFLGGDAAHLFTPTGGLGYNTAIEDAVNLGWKLASVIKGVSPAELLDSYEVERRPVALRNTDYARRFADSLGLFAPAPEIEDATDAGDEARRIAGVYLEQHARAEFNIPGVTFGGRYDGSPIIVSDGSQPPPDAANVYVPSACPGGRAPHAWLEDGVSLYDLFGFEWTLLQFGEVMSAHASFAETIRAIGVDVKLVTLPQSLRDLYQADLALIRPDQIVAWRGSASQAGMIERVLARALGHNASDSARLAS
ncbi:FAD-dependent oxidoreductase [Bradyrhizobium sp. 4]|uniref:FAD-dependent oxidoreductase n=1 Tax=unclassified Bradyrhizobium TaxID=2631580 RepID=UPI001FF934AE|nr:MULTISPECIES: FAD-dependent oxidoreductase [unclassified Bradyrhizobium]MCK1400666.1 FAD-dependent oxidoreductase [Bradyrhizobium sp. 39]MCK1753527.1 FAD-dependent oxidoreductase [Bradyrhizobium sp. 135]UPJ37692.1 FAD-dependent oxidoreductase [Bradyrhizobium sp. 4]